MSEKKNPYIQHEAAEDFWKFRPDWYRDRHQMRWYESIDLAAIAAASNEDVVDVVSQLIRYARIRDQVILHREKVAFHVGFMLRFILYSHEGTLYTVEQLMGVLKMLREYLIQMQVSSALDPDAPSDPRNEVRR